MNKYAEHSVEETPVPVSTASATARPGAPAVSLWFAGLFVFFATLCLVVLFFPFFSSHLDLTASDLGDGRFELTILEHWIKVFHGNAPLASPNFFYPERGVLGYSDAFLGLALVHAGFRFLGSDRYLAVQLATMLLAALGFVAMYHLMSGVLRFARSTALVGSTLFVISNMYYVYVVHPYILVSVVTAPALCLLVGKYCQQRDSMPARALAYLCLSGVLLSLTFYTSYYIGWCLVLCSAALLLFYVGCSAFAEAGAYSLSRTLQVAWQQKWRFILAGAIFLLFMVPFFALYLPSLHRTGKRSLGETLAFMPRALGVFDVGRDNLVWGRLSARIEDWVIPGGIHEHPVGWPLLTIVVFLATAFFCGTQLLRSRRNRNRCHEPMLFIISAIALTCLTLWTAGVRIGAHAPVWVLF